MRTWRLYAIFGAAVLPTYFLLPRGSIAQGTLFALIPASSAAAIALGVHKHRPENRRIWLMLAAAMALYAAANIVFFPFPVARGRPLAFPSVADPMFLAAYAGIAAAFVGFGRAHSANRLQRDVGGLIDSLIVTTGAAVLAWVFIVQRQGHQSLSPFELAVTYGYPSMDMLMLSALALLAYTVGRRGAAFYFVTAAVVTQLLGDIAYSFATLAGSYRFGAPLEAGWHSLAILLGVAALHPTMTDLSASRSSAERDVGPLRLIMLSIAVLIPPATIVYVDWRGRDTDVDVIAAVAAVLSLLALARTADLARTATERRRQAELARRRTMHGRVLELGAAAANESSSLEAGLAAVAERIVDVLDWPIARALTMGCTGGRSEGTTTLVANVDRSPAGSTLDPSQSWTLQLDGSTMEELATGGARWVHNSTLTAAGLGSGIALAVTYDGRPVAVIEMFSTVTLPPDDALLDVITTIGTQLRRVVERIAAQEETLHHALYDDLTGLPNRRLFRDRLAHAIAGTSRSGSVAVVLLDLDGFKEVNDTMGHETGDRLLVAVAQRLLSCIRPGDTAARLGGDELAVVVPGGDRAAGEAVAHRILDSISAPLVVDDREIFPSASVGIAVGTGTESAEELLRNADAAMYSVKEASRGGLEVYDVGMHARMLGRMELAGALRAALTRGEFHLAYQPIVVAETGHVVGVEALLRWSRPGHGLVSPAEFIPVAEQSGLIRPLGLWVLETACGQLRAWQEQLGVDSDFTMSVNVSARQLRDDGFAADVRAAVAAAGIAPASVTLEVTESALMTDIDYLVHQLHALKAVGVGLAIDDFGTGYSSLAYLRRLPVDTVKIDRSFVSGVANASDEWALTLAIVRLIRALHLKIVAEGCENAAQLAHLRALRCEFVQGYYFARPQGAAEVGALLSADVSLPLVTPRAAVG